MWKTFGEFILCLHSIDKQAAQWLATECIKVKEGKRSDYVFRDYITEWNPRWSVDSLLHWDDCPQRNSHEYWRDLHSEMKRRGNK